MYKVITHTIREEHYNHPDLARIAMGNVGSVELGANVSWHGNSYAVTSVITDPYHSPRATEYRMEAKTLFEQYNSSTRSYINDCIDVTGNIAIDEAQAIKAVNDLTYIIEPYYWTAKTEPFKKAFTEYTETVFSMVRDVRDGKDLTAADTMLKDKTQALAVAFSAMDPLSWSVNSMTKLLDLLNKSFNDQATTRKAKDWTANNTAGQDTYKILVQGQDDGTPPLWEIFSKGVIVKFPRRFLW